MNDPPLSTGTADRVPLRALIVEDSATDTELEVRELERHGYAVEWRRVEDADALRGALAEGRWDIVLSDHAMPHLTSFEALALVRASGHDLPFIVVSGSIGEETAVEAMRAGANDYLLKDRLARLGPAVVRELREARSRRARREAEEDLARSAASLALAQRLAKLGSWELDAGSRTGSWSAEMYRLLNRDPAAGPPTYAGFSELLHPEDRRWAAEAEAEAMDGGGPVEVELRTDPALGPIRHFAAHVERVVRGDGRPGLIGTLLDVTERVRATDERREQALRLATVVRAARVGLWDWDLRTNEVFFSPEWKRQIGYEDEEIGNDFSEWRSRVHPDDLEPTLKRVQEFIDNQRPSHEVEFRFRHKDGSFRWILAQASLGYGDDQRPIRMLGSHVDITDRKEAELTYARLASAIEQAMEAVVITDTAGTIQYVNPAFETITGYTAKEVSGQNARILKSGRQDAAFYRSLWETLADGRTWTGRFVNRRKDGTTYTDESVISPVRNAAGVIVSYVAVKRDVTEQIRHGEEKERLQAQLLQAQKMESVGRLAGGVAHDFNNMLSVILGHAELALGRVGESDPIHEDLDEILRAGMRSADLTRQLLAFARKQTISPKVLDLNETIASMLKLLRRLIGEDIELAFLPGPGLWNVRIDPSQVDQILANLAVNARDAIGGVGKLTIETSRAVLDDGWSAARAGSTPGEFVTLSVSDSGCGMDEETLAHAFEPFFTTKGEGKGTGLGLATVYGIVKQNGGFIDVTSSPGQGSTFRLYLPRVEGENVPATTVRVDGAPRGGGETVLLVEDEAAILALGKRVLENLGYNVLAAITPADAIRLAEQSTVPIDLLVTDVVMPGMNGRDLAALLRSTRPGLKCLFMSGYTADVIAPAGVVEEIINFIEKPFVGRQLAEKVRSALLS